MVKTLAIVTFDQDFAYDFNHLCESVSRISSFYKFGIDIKTELKETGHPLVTIIDDPDCSMPDYEILNALITEYLSYSSDIDDVEFVQESYRKIVDYLKPFIEE